MNWIDKLTLNWVTKATKTTNHIHFNTNPPQSTTLLNLFFALGCTILMPFSHVLCSLSRFAFYSEWYDSSASECVKNNANNSYLVVSVAHLRCHQQQLTQCCHLKNIFTQQRRFTWNSKQIFFFPVVKCEFGLFLHVFHYTNNLNVIYNLHTIFLIINSISTLNLKKSINKIH